MPKNAAQTKKDKLIRRRVEFARTVFQERANDLRMASRIPRDAAVLIENGRHGEGVALLREMATTLRAAADEFEATAGSIEGATEDDVE